MRNTGFGRMVASFRLLHFLSVAGFVLAGTLALLVSASSVALAAECPNAEDRTGASAGLPDCRAYELVSPADTGDQEAGSERAVNIVTSEGLLGWNSLSPIAPAGNGGGDVFLAQRTASGWQNTVIEQPGDSGDETFDLQAVTPDGSNMVVMGNLVGSTAAEFGLETTLLLRAADGSFTTVVPGSTQTANLGYDGGSSDLDTVVFNTSAQLVAGTETDAQQEAGQQQLYSWTGGTTSVVGLDSAGAPFTCGATIGNLASVTGVNAVSADGSTVFMQSSGNSCSSTSGPGPSEVYARIDGQRTVELSAPDPGVVDPNGTQPASFLGATPDGSTAYFLTSQELTSNDTNEEPDIYQWQTTDGGQTSTLTCITCGTEANTDANVQSGAVVSPDGSHVWFVARGQIDGQGVAEDPNLYVYNGKSVSLVTTQGPVGGLNHAGGETTPDGTHLLFQDSNDLTAFNSEGLQELYLVDDAASGPSAPVCVSCAPSGAVPTTDTLLDATQPNMSADGSEVFFTSENPLLPAAVNANADVKDVYEWNEGVLSLISSGTSQFSDILLGTDASGDDVFFSSDAQLVPQAVQDELAVYDARVGGGFSVATTQATTCSSADTCRGTGAVPAVPVAGTVGFVGPGDRTAAVSAAKTTTAKVRVTRTAVRGSSLRLTIEVPARGKLTIAGVDVKRLTKSAGRAGSYGLTVHLTGRAAKRLRQKRRLRVAVKVAYRPGSGKSSSASVSVTVKA